MPTIMTWATDRALGHGTLPNNGDNRNNEAIGHMHKLYVMRHVIRSLSTYARKSRGLSYNRNGQMTPAEHWEFEKKESPYTPFYYCGGHHK